MSFRLHVSRHDNARDYSDGMRFRFAVIDLNRAKDYPVNFVCMLPLHVEANGEAHNVFMRVFGDESLKVAKRLLADALRKEGDSAVKGEIERRLKLLGPKSAGAVACISCGKRFQKKPEKSFKQRFCQECLKRKFVGRK